MTELKCFYATDGEVSEIPFSPGFAYPKADVDKVIAELKEEHRWRKASEELPPDGTEVPVILSNGWRTTDYFEEDKNRWHYHWDTVAYWFPTPKSPEE